MTTKTLTHADIESHLQGYYGTEKHYHHELNKKFLYTEGAREFFNFASCYWLCDMIGSYFNSIVNKDSFNIILLTVTSDKKAVFEVKTDSNKKAYIKQDILWTDMPEGIYKLYLCDNVLKLPSEY